MCQAQVGLELERGPDLTLARDHIAFLESHCAQRVARSRHRRLERQDSSQLALRFGKLPVLDQNLRHPEPDVRILRVQLQESAIARSEEQTSELQSRENLV